MSREIQQIIVPCDCAGCCTILKADRFDFDDDEIDGPAFVEFYTQARRGASWKWRFKQAWSVLRNTDHHYFDCVSISEDDQVRLGEFFSAARKP